MAEEKKATLQRRLLGVMSGVHRIPKNGTNAFHKYQYVMESDMVDAVRPLLVEHGVMIVPSVLSSEKVERIDKAGAPKKDITRVEMNFSIYNADDASDALVMKIIGEGQDDGDKGFYKAYTGAQKYMLMKLFMISTGDDPELDTNGSTPDPSAAKEKKEAQKPAPKAEQKKESNPTPENNILDFETYEKGIIDCKTLAELKKYWLQHSDNMKKLDQSAFEALEITKNQRKTEVK